ncbi:MAG: hypothetical protein EOQ89_03550 [Mesorhizobium sp.]|nr:MAG: hypothetical protein EOQ89_03550 [Mesorhizobium sp.]
METILRQRRQLQNPNDPTSDQSFQDRAVLSQMEGQDGAGVVERTARAAALGVAKAGFETKDFLVGEPSQDQKSGIRQSFESQDRALGQESIGYSITSGVSQMVTGLIGAGKLMAPIKAAKYTKLGYEMAKGALAGAVVLDPHEERLSNLVESFPDLQNPVTEYLAAKPGDSAAEGRFKNALESIGADLLLVGAVKAIKYLRAGKTAEAAKEITSLEKAQAANKQAFGLPEELSVGGQVRAPEPKGKSGAPTSPQPLQAQAPGASPDAVVGPVDAGAGGNVRGAQAGGEAGAVPASGGDSAVIREQVSGPKPVIDPKTGQPVLPTAKTGPAQITTQEIPDADVQAILKGSAEDADAIKKFGSRQQAVDAGYKFGTAKLPWQKLHTTGNAQSLVERSAETLAARFNKAKGGAILKDARVKALANDLSEAYGEDPAMIIGELSKAGQEAPMMAARMEAALRIGNRMFNDADQLAAKIRNGDLTEFGGNRDLAVEEFKARLSVAFDTLASGNSLLSNSGRTLRRARTQFRIRPADLQKLRGLDPEKAVIIMEKAGGDPKKVAMLLNDTWSNRVLREATWHLTNGLLWMWPTHLVNTTTNAFMLAARPTEKLFGSTALRLITRDPGKRAELASVSRQAMREYYYTVASLYDGWTNAVEAFRRGDSILAPQNTEFFDAGGAIQAQPLPWKPVNSIWDFAQNAWMSASYRSIVGLPTRSLGGADEMFKTLRYRAVVQSKAAVDAQELGLTGQAYKDYLQKALDNAIDPATGRALDANAIRESQMVSFQQDLNYETTFGGSLGRGLQNLRKTAPITSLVLPFVKTPINVIRYGIKLTPGLNIVQKEFRDALIGKVGQEAQAHAIGQMALGSMFMGMAAHLAATGSMTGSGPSDYKLKQELLSTGWKPYSLTWVGSDGKRKYFQIGRFDPAATAMGLVSDIVHLQAKNPDNDYSDLIMATAVAVAKNLGEKTFLLNLNSMMDAALDPENKLPKMLGRTAGSMLPMSSLMRGHNPDPYLREARTFVDNAIRGIPGLSDNLPLTMDVWGDPVERYVGVMDSQENDLVEAEHNRIMLQTDKGIGKPSPKFEGVDLRDLTLKDGKNAYQRLQELSGHIPGQPSLKAVVAKVIKSKAYQDLVDGDAEIRGTRLNALGQTVQKYREAAKKVFLQENPELHPLIGARQREVRGAVLTNKQQKGQPGAAATSILQALSY